MKKLPKAFLFMALSTTAAYAADSAPEQKKYQLTQVVKESDISKEETASKSVDAKNTEQTKSESKDKESAKPFTIESKNIKSGEEIPNHHVFNNFGCSGENISPELHWSNPPADTKSFALTVYDPDAPTGSGWWHWVLVNIPASYRSLPANFGQENAEKVKDDVIQIRNDFGAYKYGGPCPPKGDKPHHYIFTIYALKTDKLDLPKDSGSAMAGFMIKQNAIGQAKIEGVYSRSE